MPPNPGTKVSLFINKIAHAWSLCCFLECRSTCIHVSVYHCTCNMYVEVISIKPVAVLNSVSHCEHYTVCIFNKKMVYNREPYFRLLRSTDKKSLNFKQVYCPQIIATPSNWKHHKHIRWYNASLGEE